MSRDAAYLLDILLMAKDARQFTQGVDKDAFLADRQLQYAVIRCLEVIGEAAKRLSAEIPKKHPKIPWSSMARMRDLLIHAYGKVDLEEVWNTVTQDIPVLITELEKIVPPPDSP